MRALTRASAQASQSGAAIFDVPSRQMTVAAIGQPGSEQCQ